MLYSITNAVVDAIQSSKKTFIRTFIPDHKLTSIIEEFVDAQTKYTKSAAETGIKTATDLSRYTVSKNIFGGK